MNKRIAFSILMMLCLCACAGRRIQPGEEELANDFSGRNWWLGTGVSQDSMKGDIHLNFLLMPDRVGGKPFTACFASVWMQKDSSFWYGCFFADSVSADKEGKKLNRSTFYSTAGNNNSWYLNLARTSLVLRGTLKNKSGVFPGDIPLDFVFHFPRQEPFRMFEADHGLNTTFVTIPGSGRGGSRLGASEWKGGFHLNVLKDASERLFPSAEVNGTAKTFTWIELDMDTGEHLVILSDKPTHMAGERPGVVKILQNGSRAEEKTEFILETESSLFTNSTPASFAIGYRLDAPVSNLYLRISPRKEDQIVPMKKNSFWMGAVEVTNRMTGKPAGKGNMFIFRPQ
jgi:hypothetical protein